MHELKIIFNKVEKPYLLYWIYTFSIKCRSIELFLTSFQNLLQFIMAYFFKTNFSKKKD